MVMPCRRWLLASSRSFFATLPQRRGMAAVHQHAQHQLQQHAHSSRSSYCTASAASVEQSIRADLHSRTHCLAARKPDGSSLRRMSCHPRSPSMLSAAPMKAAQEMRGL